MRTSNPALNERTFSETQAAGRRMTLAGTVNRSGILLLICFAVSVWVWHQFINAGRNPEAIMPFLLTGAFGGFVVAIITSFSMRISPFTAPLYAALEGLFIGGISSLMEAQFPGIVLQAVGLTFGVFLTLLAAYATGFIKATDNFKRGVIAATGGILAIYLATLVLGFFGTAIPYIHESGPIGIGFSLFVVTIAALNLVLDFDLIEQGAQHGAPKYMEWYAAFGLMVTLVWLYIEILRLLSKLNSRR
ncbi:Bax inhibitor-1/YccA family protein [Candidatus Sumerlaeota bacterium]|nr:Bax inhibitor-1/YccA family protein [Candidatus Sumerlaeota bacterium]